MRHQICMHPDSGKEPARRSAGFRDAFKGTDMRARFAQYYFLLFLSVLGRSVRTERLPGRRRHQRRHDFRHGQVVRTVPRTFDFPITKDLAICDPESKKTTDLERLIIGPQGGIANTVVYLKDISHGKAMDLPEQRRHLDQKRCRYIPHILLVPEKGNSGA